MISWKRRQATQTGRAQPRFRFFLDQLLQVKAQFSLQGGWRRPRAGRVARFVLQVRADARYSAERLATRRYVGLL